MSSHVQVFEPFIGWNFIWKGYNLSSSRSTGQEEKRTTRACLSQMLAHITPLYIYLGPNLINLKRLNHDCNEALKGRLLTPLWHVRYIL